MTVEQFKTDNPKLSHLEGNELLNEMEDSMLRQQRGAEILRPILPFYKKYQLRWLFYRVKPSMVFGKNDWSATSMCKECSKGVSMRMGFIFTQEDGTQKHICYCPHCGKDYIGVDNTTLIHKIFLLKSKIENSFWNILDALHLVRSGYDGRYSMFGDEARYVEGQRFDKDWNYLGVTMRKRKWWEYMFIERKYPLL